jgi:hypothetical protein
MIARTEAGSYLSYQQTEDHTCAAAAVIDILAFYSGGPGSMCAPTIGKYLENHIAEELKSSPETGTPIHHIAEYFRHKHSYWKLEWASTHKSACDISNVKWHLSLGRPVIMLINDWGGHYVVAVEYDPETWKAEGGKFTLLDPASSSEGRSITEMCSDRLRDNWNSPRGIEHGYVVAWPPS